MRLKEKVAIITGAGQGIGRAFALRFAQEGARVVIADIQEDKAKSVVQEIESTGGQALAVNVNVSQPESVKAMVQQTIARFEHIDVLINNAAIFSSIKMKPFDEITFEEWSGLMAVNLTGTFLCCQAVAPSMRAQQSGSIINISSSTVLMGRPWYAHYVTSKAGVVGMTRALARELGADSITINVVMPGSTETEVTRETVSSEQKKSILDGQSIHRRETPQDLVGALVFLASDESRFITGQTLVVDGGHNFL
ncbi:MAG: 3-oxoacyl-ACP reductase FabG [Ktedonobacteraceae bacterium]|nr:3-oxoacyl-ACP reductase FabG [Ktedonobacteraceae bacterium]